MSRPAWASILALALASGCQESPSGPGSLPASQSVPDTPYAVVLGTAQDGGLPQLGCRKDCCEPARTDPDRRRLVSSVLVVDPVEGRRWLLDATPDLPEQVERARPYADPREESDPGGRPPLFDAVLLTHAHMGHCLGLLHLGREAYGAEGQRVVCTPRMARVLREEAPWSLLVEAGHVELVEVEPGASLELSPRVRAEALPVPHRAEFSDTVGWRITTPEGSLLHLPDIDKWDRWELDLREVVRSVDVALLDATFYGGDELPGRDIREVPHPFVVETLETTAQWSPEERARIRLIHLNHTNPLHRSQSEAATRVRAAGLAVAREGEVLPLAPREQ